MSSATRSFREITRAPHPSALSTDAEGNLYIGSNSGPRIIISADGGRATINCGLCTSQGVVVEGEGALYVADAYHNRVLMRQGAGEFLTAAGNGAAGFRGGGTRAKEAGLNFPTALAVDPAGNLFIFDYLNNVVRKLTNGVMATPPTPD